jgi:hypothetical protein
LTIYNSFSRFGDTRLGDNGDRVVTAASDSVRALTTSQITVMSDTILDFSLDGSVQSTGGESADEVSSAGPMRHQRNRSRNLKDAFKPNEFFEVHPDGRRKCKMCPKIFSKSTSSGA